VTAWIAYACDADATKQARATPNRRTARKSPSSQLQDTAVGVRRADGRMHYTKEKEKAAGQSDIAVIPVHLRRVASWPAPLRAGPASQATCDDHTPN
jgi:hypothetical protein